MMAEGRTRSHEILGIRVDEIDLRELIAFIRNSARSEGSVSIFYLNPHIWNMARSSSDLRVALGGADVVWCDGIGILMAARILGKPVPGRMTAPDFIDEVCRQCAADHRTVYFLGARPGVAQRAASLLKMRTPELRIIGCHHGYLDNPEEESNVVNEIRALAPDLLLVGMGSPLQELWLTQNLRTLNIKVGWAVGALFDHLTGKIGDGRGQITIDTGSGSVTLRKA